MTSLMIMFPVCSIQFQDTILEMLSENPNNVLKLHMWKEPEHYPFVQIFLVPVYNRLTKLYK